MSRSRRPKCGTGRGCWVCGDEGAVRRRREAQGEDAIAVALVEHDEWDVDSGAWSCCAECESEIAEMRRRDIPLAGDGWAVQA